MIRIVFFDIDGTVLSHRTNAIPSSTLQALQRLKEQGIHTAGCTGRHPRELMKLNVSGFVPDSWIYLNGSLCMKDGSIISEKPLSDDTMHKLYDWLKADPIPVQFMERDYIYDNMVSQRMIEELAAVHTEPDPLEPLDPCASGGYGDSLGRGSSQRTAAYDAGSSGNALGHCIGYGQDGQRKGCRSQGYSGGIWLWIRRSHVFWGWQKRYCHVQGMRHFHLYGQWV